MCARRPKGVKWKNSMENWTFYHFATQFFVLKRMNIFTFFRQSRNVLDFNNWLNNCNIFLRNVASKYSKIGKAEVTETSNTRMKEGKKERKKNIVLKSQKKCIEKKAQNFLMIKTPSNIARSANFSLWGFALILCCNANPLLCTF